MATNGEAGRRAQRRRVIWFVNVSGSLMLVVLAIGVLVAAVAWNFAGRGPAVNAAVSKANVRMVRQAVESYHLSTGVYPPTLNALVPGYLPRVPMDAWGGPLFYAPTPGGPNPFDLRSAGLDGVLTTPDDIDAWGP